MSESSIFIISPVRGADEEDQEYLRDYVDALERGGYEVHWPHRDTDQDDPYGYNICAENRKAIRGSEEVHVYYKDGSLGSIFDLGMTFAEEKPVKVINSDELGGLNPPKSFKNLLRILDKKSRESLQDSDELGDYIE